MQCSMEDGSTRCTPGDGCNTRFDSESVPTSFGTASLLSFCFLFWCSGTAFVAGGSIVASGFWTADIVED